MYPAQGAGDPAAAHLEARSHPFSRRWQSREATFVVAKWAQGGCAVSLAKKEGGNM